MPVPVPVPDPSVLPPPLLVLCVGNPDRGDDGLGAAVARRLAGRLPAAAVRCLRGDAAELLDAWEGRDRVIVVDAAAPRTGAGTLHRLDAVAGPLPTDLLALSSHSFGVAEAVELGRALQRLPRRLLVLAVEGERFGAGEGLSPAVAAALPVVVGAVEAEWRRARRALAPGSR